MVVKTTYLISTASLFRICDFKRLFEKLSSRWFCEVLRFSRYKVRWKAREKFFDDLFTVS